MKAKKELSQSKNPDVYSIAMNEIFEKLVEYFSEKYPQKIKVNNTKAEERKSAINNA